MVNGVLVQKWEQVCVYFLASLIKHPQGQNLLDYCPGLSSVDIFFSGSHIDMWLSPPLLLSLTHTHTPSRKRSHKVPLSPSDQGSVGSPQGGRVGGVGGSFATGKMEGENEKWETMK